LLGRREKLFADLVRLEHDHRGGKVDPDKYAERRERLVSALEQVYGALDDETVAA
jgi:hemoglobin-like flavoprotein